LLQLGDSGSANGGEEEAPAVFGTLSLAYTHLFGLVVKVRTTGWFVEVFFPPPGLVSSLNGRKTIYENTKNISHCVSLAGRVSGGQFGTNFSIQ
jgi:hypothetical protein